MTWQKGSKLKVSADNERNYSWYDRVYQRAYQKGYEDGAEDNKIVSPWNISKNKPKHEEIIVALVKPYDWRTKRFCKKHGLKYCRVEGMFIDGEVVTSYFCEEEREDWKNPEYPSAILLSQHKAVEWDHAVIWLSAELPEGFETKAEEK